MIGAYRKIACAAGLLILFGTALAPPLLAQSTVAWRGLVRNGAGAPIAGARVRLAGAVRAEAVSAADGMFTLPALPPGQYKLTVEAEGRTANYAETLSCRRGGGCGGDAV